MNISLNKEQKYRPMEKSNRYLLFVIILLFQTICYSSFLYSTEVNESTENAEKEDTSDGKNDGKNDEINKAFHLFEIVESQNRFIQKMDSFYTVNLPVGIASKDPKKGEKYAIIISDIIIRNGQTFFNAYMVFKIPGSTKTLVFKGSNIPFSFSGGIKGEAKLELVSDVEVDVSSKFSLKLSGNGATYVSFDCDGFKEMAVEATLEFDSALFVPENPDGTQKEGKLSATFKTKVADWNDILISLSLEPFQFKPLKGVGFTITNAILDLSDSNNSSDISFPDNYKTDYFADGDENIWRGFYIEKAEIRLPKYFKKKKKDEGTKSEKADSTQTEKADTSKSEGSGEDDRLRFYANGMFIDDLGFTAEVGAANLLSLEDGKIGKWAFSLDTINFKIESSQLISANFNGQIKVSEFKDKNILGYSAVIGLNDSYAFEVSIADSLEMNLWMAQLMLEPNSALNITLEDGEFKPTLDLNGKLTINAPVDKKNPKANKLAVAEIPFQGMHIQSEDPYFSIDYISFGTEQNLFSKFPISIDKIKVEFDKGRLGLELGILLNFTKENAGGFGGKGGFTVWAKRTENSWEYDGIDVDEIAVDITKPDAFELHGKVLFIKGDSTYGDGFKGEVDAKFAKFGMKASALFGNINDYRYWYADAMLETEAGIPAGPISIYGFGGGAYYNMKQTAVKSDQDSEIGKSSSGVVYVPTNSSALGILASVKLGMSASKNAFNGDVKLEIAFTKSWGIEKIYFTGNGYFATSSFNTKGLMKNAEAIFGKSASSKIPKDNQNAQLSGSVDMSYDFINTSYHCNFSLFVNIAGGSIVGNSDGGKAGSGVIHFDPTDWYIQLGTPKSPNKIKAIGFATMSNYIMAGKEIPEMPNPPQNVLNGLGNKYTEYKKQRNTSELTNGSGFAFGANFTYTLGEKKYWIIYGNFGCGLGFDMLLKNYGSLSTCSNTGKPVGINGWYAQGQAYGWVSANLSIDVDLLIYKGRHSIFDAELAALLEAKAPNPFWMKGNVAGNYNILGGLVKGDFNIDFEIGEQCSLVAQSADPINGISMIAGISPTNGEKVVSVFKAPRAVFNMPIDQPFEIKDETNKSRTYRIKLNQFNILPVGSWFKPQDLIAGSISWNEKHDVATFKPKNTLPENKTLAASVELSFEERKNGEWTTVKKDGKATSEKLNITFTTDAAPKYIPLENVSVGNPQVKQFNYYKSESTTNFVKLNCGQPDLFVTGNTWELKAKITSVSGSYSSYTTINYDNSKNQVNYTLPQDLPNNTIFMLQFVKVPVPTASADNTTKNKSEKLQSNVKGNKSSMEITTKEVVVEEKKIILKEIEFFKMYFRTSKYNTFTDKINSFAISKWESQEISPKVHSLVSDLYGERFDSYEIQDLENEKQVLVSPVIAETNWYIYTFNRSFGLDNELLDKLGMKPLSYPVNTAYLYQSGGARTLTDDEIQSGMATNIYVHTKMKNDIAKYANDYYTKLQNHAAGLKNNFWKWLFLGQSKKDRVKLVLNSDFTPLQRGLYPVDIDYKLPAETTIKSYNKKSVEY
jgi:hypothetical protein